MGRKTARTTAMVSACAKRTLATACARQASSASADIASGWDLITLQAIRWRQHDLIFKAHCSATGWAGEGCMERQLRPCTKGCASRWNHHPVERLTAACSAVHECVSSQAFGCR